MARTVLLADDSVTAQNMGRRILTDAGYEVITVNNGSAALKKIHERQPDLIVLDVYMPGYGGLEVCQRLKESDVTMKIPVLLTVGKMEPFKTEEAKRVHADGHIIKPFDASELLAALTRLEDRIIPQVESRSQDATPARSRETYFASAQDPAVSFNDSNSDQISYLSQVKKRETSEHPAEESSANASGQQVQAEPALETEEREAANDGSVTFASGPIYQPTAATADEPTPSLPEFEIEHSPSESYQAAASPQVVSSSEAEVEFTPEPGPAVIAREPMLAPQSATREEISPMEPPVETEDSNTEFSPRWVAEDVVVDGEEASRSLHEEMQQAQAEVDAAQESRTEQAPESPVPHNEAESTAENTFREPELVPDREPELVSEDDWSGGAAFAAAASASGPSTEVTAKGVNGSEAEPAPGSESAAAWDNWQHIRDSVVNQQNDQAVVEAAMALAGVGRSNPPAELPKAEKNSGETVPPASAAAAPEATAQPGSNDALSNIVDNVLAELKPRLLAEIAKQLASDKK